MRTVCGPESGGPDDVRSPGRCPAPTRGRAAVGDWPAGRTGWVRWPHSPTSNSSSSPLVRLALSPPLISATLSDGPVEILTTLSLMMFSGWGQGRRRPRSDVRAGGRPMAAFSLWCGMAATLMRTPQVSDGRPGLRSHSPMSEGSSDVRSSIGPQQPVRRQKPGSIRRLHPPGPGL